MKYRLIILAVAAAFGTGVAGAQTPPIGTPSTPPTSTAPTDAATGAYNTLDQDKDGLLTKKEIASNRDVSRKWDMLDVNKDGNLDQSEYARFEAEASVSGSASTPPPGAPPSSEEPQSGTDIKY